MDRKRTALAVAAGGTATGLAGLVLLVSPAGASGAPPVLPEVTPEALVASVLTAQVPAMSGTVEMTNDLGLPVPAIPQAAADGKLARVFSDGQGRFRVALEGESGSERTVVSDGATTWMWDAADRTVLKSEGGKEASMGTDRVADPAGTAQQFISAMQADSVITVDGTARVADRPVYQLVLTPKPTERTLLGEVRVAVDEQTRLPLRLEVLVNGQADPVFSVGFSAFAPGAQDAGLFSYTPPAGVEVKERSFDGEKGATQREQGMQLLEEAGVEVKGTGWDTVVVGKLPAEALSGKIPAGEGPSGFGGGRGDSAQGPGTALDMVKQIATPVSGDWGSGYVVTTKVGTALLSDDGRFAAGAVPQQVLTEALAQK